MKIRLISVIALTLTVSACSDKLAVHEPGTDPNSYIEFNNYVDVMTRAAKHSVSRTFEANEAMGVWGFQTTGEYNDVIFNNQRVYCVDGTRWTYNNKKLWNIGSTYMFYGFYPYSEDLYTFSEDRLITIQEYVTPADTALQQDLMISEQRNISPFNTVDMIFHHILSNVNFRVKISDNLDKEGISSVKLMKFNLTGVKSTARYEQTGWNRMLPTGTWSGQRGSLEVPEITDIELDLDGTTSNVLNEYLVIPQGLYRREAGAADDISLNAIFRIEYTDGTASTFIKQGIRLAGITGISTASGTKIISSWESNNRYNYTLAFNPMSSTRIWDADGDGSLIIDPETGEVISDNDDTPTDGTMQYNPDDPDIVSVLEDTDGDGVPDTWVDYPIVWEDIDGDDLLEGGIDRDGDGHIDNVDGDNTTNQGGDPDKDPTDGNINNPDGKDVIVVHIDTNGDGVIDDNDDWVQLQKDPDTGKIYPSKETDDATIEFTATVTDWDDAFHAEYTEK